jgi:hypothetical protein
LPAFAAALRTQPWAGEVIVEENRLRVVAADPTVGQEALLPLVVAHDLPLLRYEWLRPNLEEIFLSLSEEEKS